MSRKAKLKKKALSIIKANQPIDGLAIIDFGGAKATYNELLVILKELEGERKIRKVYGMGFTFATVCNIKCRIKMLRKTIRRLRKEGLNWNQVLKEHCKELMSILKE